MKVLATLLRAAVFGAALCHLPCVAAEPPPSQALAQLAQRYHDTQARLDPLYSATMVGDNRFDDRLPLTIAPAQRRERFAAYRRFERALQAIDRGALNEHDALTHDLLARDLRTRLGFEPFHDHLLPLQQMDAVPLLLASFAGGQGEQPLQTAAQHRAYLRRLALLPAWLRQAAANMRQGLQQTIVPPRAVVAAALPQLRALGSADAAANPFLAPLRRGFASLPATERPALAAAYRRIALGQAAPALRRFVAFVERDVLPAARASAGWSALPNGDAWYRQWVRDQTTSELTPEQIHTMGLQEVARLQRELAALAPRLGHEDDPAQLLAWVRTNPRFLPFTSEAQILERYRAIDARVRQHLPRLFGRMPKAPLDIRPEPALTRATASDHYALPADDGSRPGIFWAVINDPAAYDASTMTALFLHEGQPGHHFQMALQQEMALPAFRQRAWINAFGEGWALYAETLGREMGLYDDPAALAGELRLEMMRAARLVVDTGLHAFGWPRERALAYFVETVGATPAQAANQIDRYMAWPAQALGYKLGALKIQALRERAQQRLGERFDLAAFHDAVLGDGALPLSLLEARIERWIERRRADQR